MDVRAAVRDRPGRRPAHQGTAKGLLTTAVAANPSRHPAAQPATHSTSRPCMAALTGCMQADVSQVRMLVDSNDLRTYGRDSCPPTATIQRSGKGRNAGNDSGAEDCQRRPTIRDALVAGVGNTPNAVMALFGGGVRILIDPYTRAHRRRDTHQRAVVRRRCGTAGRCLQPPSFPGVPKHGH